MGPPKKNYQKYLGLFFHSTILITSFFISIAIFPGNLWGADVYIDPTYSGIELGTFDKPYNSWTDITSFTALNDYRQKCGTSETLSDSLAIKAIGASDNFIVIGAYNADGSHEDGANETFGEDCSGGFEKPILRRTINGTGAILITAEGTKQYLHINSIKFIKAETPVYVRSNYNKIRYCYFFNTEWGLRVGVPNSGNVDGDYNTIEYNHFNQNDAENGGIVSGDAIQLHYRAQHNLIQYNHVTGFDHAGLYANGGDYNTFQYNYVYASSDTENECINMDARGNYNIFRYNYCKDAGQGVELLGVSNNEIYGNVLTCAGAVKPSTSYVQGCIQIDSGGSAATQNNKIYNNVVYDSKNYSGSTGLFLFSNKGDTGIISGNVIYNNIFLNISGYCIRSVDITDTISGNSFYNNSCYGYRTNKFSTDETNWGIGTVYATASAFNAVPYAANNRDDDPGLSNPSAGQFWPDGVNDNVVGTGYNLGLKYNQILDPVATDFTDSPPIVKTKDQTGDWFIGAYALSIHKKPGKPGPKKMSGFHVISKEEENTN